MKSKYTKLALVATLSLSFSAAHAELAVIVNPAHEGELTAELVRSIYLGQNQSLKPIEQSKGSDDRSKFLESVVEMTESKFKRHWSKLIFSGKARPPNTLGSNEAILSFVASNLNAIGYVDASLIQDKPVKVALRVK